MLGITDFRILECIQQWTFAQRVRRAALGGKLTQCLFHASKLGHLTVYPFNRSLGVAFDLFAGSALINTKCQ